MDRASIFERVSKHLLSQNKQARRGLQCLYQTESGLRCAVGCLIPDGHKVLKSDLDLISLLRYHPDLKELWGVKDDSDIEYLLALQVVHDNCEPEYWAEELEHVKERYIEQN